MTTLRDLLALGFDLDTEVVAYATDDDDHAWSVDMEVRHVDDPSNRTVITLTRGAKFVMIADLDDDERELIESKPNASRIAMLEELMKKRGAIVPDTTQRVGNAAARRALAEEIVSMLQ